MGLCKEYNVFGTFNEKNWIENRLNEYCKANSADGKGLESEILWLNVICENFDEASAYLKSLDDKLYPNVAIQYLLADEPTKYWLVKTQFETKPSLVTDKKSVLDFLSELMYDLETTIPEALYDEYWNEKRRALQIAMNVIKTADEETISKEL